MIEINNITYIEYFELEESEKQIYNQCIKYAYSFNLPVDHFEIGDFMQISFGIIKDIQFDLSEGLIFNKVIEYLSLLSGKKQNMIAKEKLLTVCQARKYLINEIDRITEIENIALSHIATSEELEAGINELSSLGSYLQFRSLTGGDVTKLEHIRNLKYELCFTELVTQRKLSDYDEKLFDIRSKRK